MRKVVRWSAIILALLSAVFYIGPAARGALLLIDWVRLLGLRGPYFRYGYFSSGVIDLLYSGCGTALIVRAVRKPPLSILAAVASLLIGLVGTHMLANLNPDGDMSVVVLQLRSHTYQCLTDWDEKRGQFPKNQQELRDALAVRPLREEEAFFLRDKAIPYDVRVVTNANGPALEPVPPNPGTVVYAVSPDYMEYWLTVTTLDDPAGGPVIMERVFGIYGGRAWVVHRKHDDPGDWITPSME